MREMHNRFVKIFAQIFNAPQPIVEVGSFQVKGQEFMADLRPYFPNKKYIGCDMRKGKGVDKIDNVEKLSFKNNSIGTVICLNTLEHVQNPIKAVEEMYRVLKPGGFLVLSSLMDFEIHDYPHDYWRFTPECFELLTRQFKNRLVGWEGRSGKPHSVYAIACKHCKKDLSKQFKDFEKKYQAAAPQERTRRKVRKFVERMWGEAWQKEKMGFKYYRD